MNETGEPPLNTLPIIQDRWGRAYKKWVRKQLVLEYQYLDPNNQLDGFYKLLTLDGFPHELRRAGSGIHDETWLIGRASEGTAIFQTVPEFGERRAFTLSIYVARAAARGFSLGWILEHCPELLLSPKNWPNGQMQGMSARRLNTLRLWYSGQVPCDKIAQPYQNQGRLAFDLSLSQREAYRAV
jgi:hypothetical protein